MPSYTVIPCIMDTRLIQTCHYYGQFALSLGLGSPYIFSKFDPLNTDSPIIQTLPMAPSVSVLPEFDCSLVSEIFYAYMQTLQDMAPISRMGHHTSRIKSPFDLFCALV